MAELVLDKVKASGGKAEKAEGTNDSSELDLAGDREFLTAESASEALAPLLAEGSTITKVPSLFRKWRLTFSPTDLPTDVPPFHVYRQCNVLRGTLHCALDAIKTS